MEAFMNGLYGLLAPIEWVVANIMVLWHRLFDLLGVTGGWTWTLAIVGLVVTIRLMLIPVFVRQIKAQRSMQLIAPELRAVQDKYKGKKDQASREAMTRETMELYSKHKTSPFASCLPLLLQTPIFFALFRVLNNRLEGDGEPIGLLTSELIAQAKSATIFNAGLSETFLKASTLEPKLVTGFLIAAMVATTFFSQRQLSMKNMPPSALEGPMGQQQKILVYVLPFVFVISGPNFPIGVLLYWTVSNLWSMGQQFYVIRNNPTPGSQAEKALLERKTAKAARKGLTIDGLTFEEARLAKEAEEAAAAEERRNRQRQQPKRKKRAKGATAPRLNADGTENLDTLSEELDIDGDDNPPGIKTN